VEKLLTITTNYNIDDGKSGNQVGQYFLQGDRHFNVLLFGGWSGTFNGWLLGRELV